MRSQALPPITSVSTRGHTSGSEKTGMEAGAGAEQIWLSDPRTLSRRYLMTCRKAGEDCETICSVPVPTQEADRLLYSHNIFAHLLICQENLEGAEAAHVGIVGRALLGCRCKPPVGEEPHLQYRCVNRLSPRP